jgi:hypothetical protein
MKAITTYFHASDLFAIAERAADAKNSDPDGPIVAIMFCVIALEAFINESGELARAIPTAKQQEIIKGYAQVMTELKDRREGLLLKYHFALLVFKGSTINDHNVLPPRQDDEALRVVALLDDLHAQRRHPCHRSFSPPGVVTAIGRDRLKLREAPRIFVEDQPRLNLPI